MDEFMISFTMWDGGRVKNERERAKDCKDGHRAGTPYILPDHVDFFFIGGILNPQKD